MLPAIPFSLPFYVSLPFPFLPASPLLHNHDGATPGPDEGDGLLPESDDGLLPGPDDDYGLLPGSRPLT